MLLTKRKSIRQLVGLAETTNWLFLKLLLRNPGAARMYPGEAFRLYMSLAKRDKWRAGTIIQIFPELRERDFRITLQHMPGRGIRTPVDELAYMALITAWLQPRLVFEFGTFRGRTALNFALNSPQDCEIHTLDLGELDDGASDAGDADAHLVAKRIPGEDYKGRDVAPKIHQLFGNSLGYDFSRFEGKVDLVFVDGGHTYEVAHADTENALRMCRPGGVILWHDFANYGDYHDVIRAVLDCLPGDQIYQIHDTQLAVYRVPQVP